MANKKFRTSKIVLWVCIILSLGLMGISIYGWFQHLADAIQFFICSIVMLVSVTCVYLFTASSENKIKCSNGNNIMNDIFTALKAIFTALSSNDIQTAMSTLIEAMQSIIANRPDMSQADMPQISYNVMNFEKGNNQDSHINDKSENMGGT